MMLNSVYVPSPNLTYQNSKLQSLKTKFESLFSLVASDNLCQKTENIRNLYSPTKLSALHPKNPLQKKVKPFSSKTALEDILNQDEHVNNLNSAVKHGEVNEKFSRKAMSLISAETSSFKPKKAVTEIHIYMPRVQGDCLIPPMYDKPIVYKCYRKEKVGYEPPLLELNPGDHGYRKSKSALQKSQHIPESYTSLNREDKFAKSQYSLRSRLNLVAKGSQDDHHSKASAKLFNTLHESHHQNSLKNSAIMAKPSRLFDSANNEDILGNPGKKNHIGSMNGEDVEILNKETKSQYFSKLNKAYKTQCLNPSLGLFKDLSKSTSIRLEKPRSYNYTNHGDAPEKLDETISIDNKKPYNAQVSNKNTQQQYGAELDKARKAQCLNLHSKDSLKRRSIRYGESSVQIPNKEIQFQSTSFGAPKVIQQKNNTIKSQKKYRDYKNQVDTSEMLKYDTVSIINTKLDGIEIPIENQIRHIKNTKQTSSSPKCIGNKINDQGDTTHTETVKIVDDCFGIPQSDFKNTIKKENIDERETLRQKNSFSQIQDNYKKQCNNFSLGKVPKKCFLIEPLVSQEIDTKYGSEMGKRSISNTTGIWGMNPKIITESRKTKPAFNRNFYQASIYSKTRDPSEIASEQNDLLKRLTERIGRRKSSFRK